MRFRTGLNESPRPGTGGDLPGFHREDMLQDAELLAVLGQHRDTGRDTLVGDLGFIVHNGQRYSRRPLAVPGPGPSAIAWETWRS